MTSPKTSKKTPPVTLAGFVRSLPKDMPAKTVVEKARAAGLKIGEDYVYKVRSAARVAKKAAKKAAKQAKSTSGARVAKAAPAHKAPTLAPKSAAPGASAPTKPAAARAPTPTPKADTSASKPQLAKGTLPTPRPSPRVVTSFDAQFFALLGEIGAERADQLVAEFRVKLKSMKAG